MNIAIAIALLFVGLLIYIAGDIWATKRARKWEDMAADDDDDEVTAQIPITVVEDEPAARETYLGLSQEIARPIFTITSLLDGGSRVPRDFGKN